MQWYICAVFDGQSFWTTHNFVISRSGKLRSGIVAGQWYMAKSLSDFFLVLRF